MQLKLKYSHWPLLVLILILGFTSAFAAGPVLQSVTYHDDTNVLEFVFDQLVYNQLEKINRSYITLDGDQGGPNPDLTLTGGTLADESDSLLSTILLKLSLDDQKVIENMVDRESLMLVMRKYAFLNSAFEASPAVLHEDAFSATYNADQNPPTALSAIYDASTNLLTITFSEIVDPRSIDLIRMSVDDDAGGANKDLQFSTDHVVSITPLDNTVLELGFTHKHQQKLEAMDASSLSLLMSDYFILDKDDNTNTIMTPEAGLAIEYIAEPELEKIKIDSANYDAGTNRLTIYLNEAPVTSYRWYGNTTGAVRYEGISIHDLGGDTPVVATLSGMRTVSTKGSALQIEVLPADQRLIEILEHRDALKLTVAEFAVLDKQMNGIQNYGLDDNISISWTAIEESQTPGLDSVKYDASQNALTFSFGNISARTRGIDTSNVILSGIKLTVGDTVYTLSGGVVSGEKSGRPAYIRHVDIEVTTPDEAVIELNSGKNITVSIDELAFVFEKTLNGNFKIENVPLQYVADENPPSIVRLKYDFQQNLLLVDFDKLIHYDQFKPADLTIGGVNLTGGIINEQLFTEQFTITVNSTDSTALNTLDISVKKDLQVELAAGAAINLDGISNPAMTFKNADTTAAGDTVVVGYGRGFWDRSFEAFPTPDELVSASLRGVGEYCYIYVADDQWLITVNDSAVQVFIEIFEISCPADANQGIYQLCREAYGEEVDTDGDPKIVILFTDLRDQYGRAVNNRSATWPKAGYFTTLNEAPLSEYGHSNQVDLLYVDAFPIVEAGLVGNVLADQFTRMILAHSDEDEEQWLVEGIAAMSQMLCGYEFQSFEVNDERVPAMKLKCSTKNVLTLWTGWQAGMLTDWLDLYNTFLFNLYLYEQYGGFDIIKLIATDGRNQGLASIDTALAKWATQNQQEVVTAADVYPDFALTCFMDNWAPAEYAEKYTFNSVDLGTPDLGTLDWKRDSNWRDSFNWTFQFIKVKQSEIPDILKFNGTDGSDFKLTVASMTDSVIKIVAIDSGLSLGVIDLADTTNADVVSSDVVIVVSNVTAGVLAQSNFVLSKDEQAPENVQLNIFQNPSADRVLDVYFVFKEKIYQDVPTGNPLASTQGEGPIIEYTWEGPTRREDETRSLIAERSFSNSNEGMFLYHAELAFDKSGSYEIVAKGQDMAGNIFDPAATTKTLAIRKVLAKNGGVLESADHLACLHIQAGTLPVDNFIMTFIDETVPGEKVYRFGTEDIELSQPASLSIQYTSELNGNELTIYQKVDGEWKSLGGIVNLNARTISATVEQLGDFMIAKGQPDAILDNELVPDEYSLAQNYPNPFNPATTIRYALPQDGFVTLTVFNILGEEVTRLLEKQQKAGFHSLQWDAKGLGSGVYFYKLVSGDFSMIRKMTMLK